MGVNLKIKDSYKSHVEFVTGWYITLVPSRCAYTRRGDFSTTVVRDFNWPCTSGSDDDDEDVGVILKKRGWIQLYTSIKTIVYYTYYAVCASIYI